MHNIDLIISTFCVC